VEAGGEVGSRCLGEVGVRVLHTAFDADAMSERLPAPEFTPGTSLHGFQQNGHIRVGVAPDSPGFTFLDESTGRFSGLEIAFTRKVAQAIFGGSAISSSSKVEFVQVPLVDRLVAIESGRVDIVVSQLAISSSRRERVGLTDPYFGTSLGFIARDDRDIDTVEQLQDCSIAVIEESIAEVAIERHSLGHKLFPVESHNEMMELLHDGRVDAAMSASVVLEGFARLSGGELVAKPWQVESIAFAIGLPKGDDELREFLNVRVRGLVDSGFVAFADTLRRRGV
jgi:polar amino acid transport system substrate-binding protein